MKIFRRVCFAISCWVFFSQAQAARDEPSTYRHLLEAKSASELARTVSRGHRLKHLELVCEAELKSSRIPVSCFRVLSIEMAAPETARLAMLAVADRPDPAHWLGGLCRRRADASNSWTDLHAALQTGVLPKDCAGDIRRRVLDLQYTDETERPDELFKNRWAGVTERLD